MSVSSCVPGQYTLGGPTTEAGEGQVSKPALSDAEAHTYLIHEGQLSCWEELSLWIYHSGVELLPVKGSVAAPAACAPRPADRPPTDGVQETQELGT